MESITCSSIIDSENQRITLIGFRTDNIVIDYSGDIDFTPFVTLLAELIDFDKSISFTYEDLSQKTEKEKLIIETLIKIIDSYNTNLGLTNENLELVVDSTSSDDSTF